MVELSGGAATRFDFAVSTSGATAACAKLVVARSLDGAGLSLRAVAVS